MSLSGVLLERYNVVRFAKVASVRVEEGSNV